MSKQRPNPDQAFRVKRKYRQSCNKRKRAVEKRLRGAATTGGHDGPVIECGNVDYELSTKANAIHCGGIGVIHQLARQSGLIRGIDGNLKLLKRHLPYHESDHVLSLTYNILCGGQRLEDIELLRTNVPYLEALRAERIPDPTTSGDFLRRFEEKDIHQLMDIINESRQRVWKRHARKNKNLLEEAFIDGDGTIVGTQGRSKAQAAFSYKGIWGYHPLIISLANTREVLFCVNRPGNKTSSDDAARYYDKAIELVAPHAARICLRGDTDFSQCKHLDGWDGAGHRFIFGFDAQANVKKAAEALDCSAWEPLKRLPKYEIKTKTRKKPERHKDQAVLEKEYKNIELKGEEIAEFEYQPGPCKKSYRMVVLKKNLSIKRGEKVLIDDVRYFFYITNNRERKAAEIVALANERCDQENVIEQCKNGVNAMRLPVNDLLSNWAYMVIAILAWNLKAWYGLTMSDKKKGREVLGMEFRRFLNGLILVPTQIVRSGRRIIFRLLNYNDWVPDLLRTWAEFKRGHAWA